PPCYSSPPSRLHSLPTRLSSDLSATCSIANNAYLASLEPSSTRGSIWERRAPMTANSPATKNAFPTKSTISHSRPGICSLMHPRSEEHTSELQSRFDIVCRLLLV